MADSEIEAEVLGACLGTLSGSAFETRKRRRQGGAQDKVETHTHSMGALQNVQSGVTPPQSCLLGAQADLAAMTPGPLSWLACSLGAVRGRGGGFGRHLRLWPQRPTLGSRQVTPACPSPCPLPWLLHPGRQNFPTGLWLASLPSSPSQPPSTLPAECPVGRTLTDMSGKRAP